MISSSQNGNRLGKVCSSSGTSTSTLETLAVKVIDCITACLPASTSTTTVVAMAVVVVAAQ